MSLAYVTNALEFYRAANYPNVRKAGLVIVKIFNLRCYAFVSVTSRIWHQYHGNYAIYVVECCITISISVLLQHHIGILAVQALTVNDVKLKLW